MTQETPTIYGTNNVVFTELKLSNEETIAAMKELDSGNLKIYDSMKDLWNEIDND